MESLIGTQCTLSDNRRYEFQRDCQCYYFKIYYFSDAKCSGYRRPTQRAREGDTSNVRRKNGCEEPIQQHRLKYVRICYS